MGFLPDTATIAPNERLTVHLSAYFGSASTLTGEIVRVFSGTIFPVSKVNVPWLVGTFAMEGVTKAQGGLLTTLPGRNITVSEFREFLNSRLNLAGGALGLSASGIESGGIETASGGAGSLIPELGAAKPYVYVGLGILALVVIGYAASGVGRLVRG